MRSAEALEVVRPRSLGEALARLAANPSLTPLAGGTDLLVLSNAGMLGPVRRFLDLWPLDALRGISVEKSRGRRVLVLGALATFSDCIASAAVAELLPILARASAEVGGVQIQNRGTLAGNVGNASPAADSLPVLFACDTEVVLASSSGERVVPLASYYTGYRKSVRRSDELIVRLRVAVPPGRQHFRKVGTRAAQAISKVVMAAITHPGGHRIAFGSVAPTVVRAAAVERYLDGGGADRAEAARLLAGDIAPIDDVRSTAAYRLRVAQNLVGAMIE